MYITLKKHYTKTILIIEIVEVHKHIGLSLDKKLDFNIHIDNRMNICHKILSRMERLSLSNLCDSLLSIDKTFFCPRIYNI